MQKETTLRKMGKESNIRATGLQGVLQKRLSAVQEEMRKEIIPFSLIFHRLCSAFHITKEECWELLSFLQDKEMVKIVPFHGIRIIKSSLQGSPDN